MTKRTLKMYAVNLFDLVEIMRCFRGGGAFSGYSAAGARAMWICSDDVILT